MIDGKLVLGLIPARGGSKRVPFKNLQHLGDLSLLEITISQACASHLIDEVVVSSDDPKILHVANKAGAKVLQRPKGLSQDSTPGVDPVIHALEVMPEFQYVVLLQVTSPFRVVEDIDAAISYCVESHAPACVSVCRPDHHPAWMFSMSDDGKLSPLQSGELPLRSQDLPPCYVLNGAIYIVDRDVIIKRRSFLFEGTVAYEMPTERSLDIDTELDLKFARFLWEQDG